MAILVSLLLAPLLIANLMFLAELTFGVARRQPGDLPAEGRGATIIVPAHDEASVIERTLKGFQMAGGVDFPILVVADNCADTTAAIARRLGVAVIERNDDHQRGKGYALSFARDCLRAKPPSAVIVLDADCRIDAQSLQNLTGACDQTNGACQAINLLDPSLSASPMVQISTFAFMIKNLIRQRGLQRLTGGVHLTGTGMCLPWHLFNQADLATASIVEDIRLGIELTRLGKPPQLAEGSYVWSAHADLANSLSQRGRWEGGFLAIARTAAPEMLLRGVRNLAPRTILSGLDMLVPPLAMLAIINAGVLLLVGAMAAAGALSWAPALVLGSIAILDAAALFIAWLREGRDYLSLKTLAKMPLYVLWKVPMYLGLVKRGAPAEWLRTERPTETDREA